MLEKAPINHFPGIRKWPVDKPMHKSQGKRRNTRRIRASCDRVQENRFTDMRQTSLPLFNKEDNIASALFKFLDPSSLFQIKEHQAYLAFRVPETFTHVFLGHPASL